jgi:hypothetical protein
MRCFVHLYPDHTLARARCVKERLVVDALREGLPPEIVEKLVFNRRIQGGDTRRKPDVYLECGTHGVIGECDEHQHEYYERICENRRVVELWQDSRKPVVAVVRFNPDAYTDAHGVRHASCFSYDKNGLPYVPKTKRKEWFERLEKFVQVMQYSIDNVPDKSIDAHYLFYDGYDATA